jgi:chromosome segregation ATPase
MILNVLFASPPPLPLNATLRHYRCKCSISASGASEYKINGKPVNAKEYNEALTDHNILVKAKNFLVFQGDVEAVASQSPKDLMRLIEQISGWVRCFPARAWSCRTTAFLID